MATIRNNVFEKAPSYRKPEFQVSWLEGISRRSRIYGYSAKEKERKNSLRDANVIVCGGRGLGDKEGFKLLKQFADLIGASVGATRVAVDSKWIDYSHQIGQTGLVVKPKLYIAFGVSGAAEHIVGMDRADVIVSVNTDRDAPINLVSDYIVQKDCKKVLQELIAFFSKEN